jgi:hypothetical protein
MKAAVLVLGMMVTVMMVQGELLQMLHLLHQHDVFHYLTAEDQVSPTLKQRPPKPTTNRV